MDDGVRAQIRELLETGLPTEGVARQLGVPKGTVSAVKAHMTMGSYGGSSPGAGSLSEADVEEIEDAASLKFGLERDMQDALRRNIHQLDPALRIVDDGRERRVEAGRIDILAEDDQGSLVVIELKSGEAPESAITQVLSYIGSLQAEEDPRPVRGMLIARNFSTRVRLAARAAGIQLVATDSAFRSRLATATKIDRLSWMTDAPRSLRWPQPRLNRGKSKPRWLGKVGRGIRFEGHRPALCSPCEPRAGHFHLPECRAAASA